MPNINITVREKIAHTITDTCIVCGNSDYVAVFDFDAEWDAYEVKTARFIWGGAYTDVAFAGNECPVPVIPDAVSVLVGVYAGDLHTTTAAAVGVRRSILGGSETEAEVSHEIKDAFGKMLAGKIDAPQTAAVGDVLTVEEVDAEGKPKKWKTAPAAAEQKQADWNQNDETASDYVKNRPFYETNGDPLGEIVFTAESASKITHAVNAMSMKVLNAIKSVVDSNAPQPRIRLFLCGKFYAVNADLDMGDLVFASDEILGSVPYRIEEELYFAVQDNSISFTVGESYSVSFFNINKKGYVKIPFEYFPDSIFTQKSAPVRYGDGELSTIQGNGTTASGIYSHAEGDITTASGNCSHAEGSKTTASGVYSHAEGYATTASGDYSHAEGYVTVSSFASHAEGIVTNASGAFSHAEGESTTASGEGQHVQGKNNIPDTTSAHIVGNGESDTKRSNAHTLDWQGNAWFSGNVYVGSTSGINKDEGSKKLLDTSDLLVFANEIKDATIPKPTTAKVGQIVKIKAVDVDGKVTETEAVDMPSVDYIIQSSTAGSTKKFKITVDDSGTLTATELV